MDRIIFLIGAPRSGTTLLARMLGAHSMIYGRAEPHLITPIAHLGYYANVQKAPYDPFNAEQAIREFVTDLPRGEADYLDALRAYTDTLYERMLSTAPGKRFFLDKTPAYALVLPFLVKLYPDAKYIVLTRHPLAVLSSWVESFFDGDYQVALNHNPLLARYVPALARILRERPVPFVHVRYEELVREPEANFRRICDHLGIPFEAAAIEYGEQGDAPKGLGDPTGVAQHNRPVTSSISKWAAEIAAQPELLALVGRLIEELDPADLETLGYPREKMVAQLEADGWTHLPNRRTELAVDGVRLEVMGMDDPHIERHDLRVAPRRDPAALGLAVVHSPDPAPELAALGYDLILSGHTHGGQVRLPVVGAIVTNSQMPTRLCRGLSRLGSSILHISPGLGTSKFAPFRFLCRPEATILELVPAPVH